MMELERGATRIAEELGCTTHPWMPFGSQNLDNQRCGRAQIRKEGSVKDVGVILLAALILLFTGVIGGRALMEVLYCRNLQAQIEQRLIEVTR